MAWEGRFCVKDDNFLKKWIIPIIISTAIMTALLILVIYKIINKEYYYILLLLLPIILAVCIFIYLKKNVKEDTVYFLKHPNPDKMIEYYKRSVNTLSKSYDSEAIIAYNVSLVYCYWGEFEKALKQISVIDWEKKKDMYKAFNLNIRTLLCYFGDGNYTEGLKYARAARQYATVSKLFPGNEKSEMLYDTYIEIGQVLTGLAGLEVVTSLEFKFKDCPNIMLKLIIAWGLANAYHHTNQYEKVDKMLHFCKKNAPFCKSIHQIKKLTSK